MKCRLNAFISSASNYWEYIFCCSGYLNETSKPYNAETIFSWVKKEKSFVCYLTSSVEISENIFDRFENVLVWTGVFAKLLSKIFLYFFQFSTVKMHLFPLNISSLKRRGKK